MSEGKSVKEVYKEVFCSHFYTTGRAGMAVNPHNEYEAVADADSDLSVVTFCEAY